MHIRNYIYIFLLLFCSLSLSAQTFTTLDWKNPSPIYEGDSRVETDMPGFAGAHYLPDTYLPCYLRQIDLGWDYDDYDYDVKIEYPVFRTLTKRETAALAKTNYQFSSYPEVSVEVFESAKKGVLNVRFIPIIYKDGVYKQVYSFKLNLIKNKKVRPLRAVTRAESSQGYAENSVLSSGKWVKIKVTDTGVYQITNNELSRMGFSDPSKVRLYGYGGNILPEDLRLVKIDDLQQVPLWREASSVLFYAKGTIKWEKSGDSYVHTQNHYATYGCYFLTQSDEAPMEFPKENSLEESGATTVNTFPDYALYEKEETNWLEGGRLLFDSYDYKNGATKSYSFTLPGITNDEGRVRVAFSAYSSASTTVSVSINGVEQSGRLSIGASGGYIYAQIENREFVWSGDKTEKNTITLTHTLGSGASGRLDYIRLNYTRELALYNSYTLFRGKEQGKMKFVIGNANENTKVWNVADPMNNRQVVGTLSDGKYTLITDNSVDNEFVVLNTNGSFGKVEVLGTVSNQNLHQLKGIDMVIITPPNSGYITQAERLAEYHRQNDSLSVEVVTSEQVYNEFSSGTPDGTAYRRFMKMLYDRASSEKELPKYLLLFGDGSFDNRMLTPAWKSFDRNNFLLTYVSEDSFDDTKSYVLDDYFGFLGTGKGLDPVRDLVDIGVGRFPVRSEEQAKEIVDKMIVYMGNKNTGPWKNSMCFLGDDAKDFDSQNVHMYQADSVARLVEQINPSFLIKRVYWDAYKMEVTPSGNRYPAVHKKILELMNDGLLVLNYTGHGSPASLSDEYVMVSEDFANVRSPRAPLFLTAACDVAPFDRIDTSLGEYAFLNPNGGAIAVYSTTRTVYGEQNFLMNKIFMRQLLTKIDGKRPRLGDVVKATKVEIAPRGYVNSLHFCFLGDPAMELSYPDAKVVIDRFNNQQAENDESATIKAGGLVSVEGRVLDETGNTDVDFNGTIHPTVLDTKETITTYNNNGHSTDGAFKYVDRNKILFAGSDSIKSGTFKFTFPVPLDINYSFENGLVNLYAVDNDKEREGQGYFDNFLIGGTEDGAVGTDSLGPKINLYLNTPDFVYGGKVNETPYLVAELEDEDGINMVGNGIGHDLVAIIDGSPVYTYVLNNYYESGFGDYTKGTVRYSFSELPEGKHQLIFRAWDIKNNSSSVLLDFEVVRGLKPGLFELSCTKSPVKDNTTFILTHDRPESELDIRIEVYDFSGRTLWVHQENGVSSDNYYYVDWDLTTNSGGRVSPGVYLFRASVSADGSKESTKARKIVVLAQ